MKAKHTETPWHVREDRSMQMLDIVAENGEEVVTGIFPDEKNRANAAFIVRACNAHDDLVQALKDCVEVMDDHLKGLFVIQPALRQAYMVLAEAGAK